MANNTQADLSTPIDITTSGECADSGEVKVIMTLAQLTAIRNTLNWNVDLETVELDNDEPERAALVIDFVGAVDAAVANLHHGSGPDEPQPRQGEVAVRSLKGLPSP